MQKYKHIIINISIITLFLVKMLAINTASYADMPRYVNEFTSENGRYILRYEFSKREWKLIDKKNKTVKYQIKGEFNSGTVLISNDGVHLVIIDDYSERKPSRDLDMLIFYRNGIETNKYTLGDLLSDITNVEHSASHFLWYLGDNPIHINNSQIEFKTYELVNYQFDITTGKIIKKTIDPILTPDSLYVYGEIKKIKQGLYVIEICHLVQGLAPKNGMVEFTLAKKDMELFYGTVVLKNGVCIATPHIIFNECNYRHRKNATIN